MAKQLNIAIIGCGGISNSHMPNILKTPEMRLVATMDLVEEAERPNGKRFGAKVRAEEGNRIISRLTWTACFPTPT
mgnify:CR=1 FL=1